MSVRLDDGWLLTPTNSSLGALDPARLSKLDSSGRVVSGDPPSKEAFLHRGMYEARAAARAIVHLHSTHAAAVSCMTGLDPGDCIPPLTPYYVMKIGRLPLVPYQRPGDPALGEVMRDLAKRHAAVLLANHGPVVSGASLEAAVNAAEELEETAKLFLLLRGQRSAWRLQRVYRRLIATEAHATRTLRPTLTCIRSTMRRQRHGARGCLGPRP